MEQVACVMRRVEDCTKRRRRAPLRLAAAGVLVLFVSAGPAVPQQVPATADIVNREIVPRLEALSLATLRLQNAVVRHCTIADATTMDGVEEAFAGVVIALASVEPFAYAFGGQRRITERFMTRIADTAFSRIRLGAMVTGSEEPPLTLAALVAEEPALIGLPALAFLLFAPAQSGAEERRRCAMAEAVAAGLRERAHTRFMRWRTGAVPTHWADDSAPLAERRRLRDLVQGSIVAVDRLDRTVAAFDARPEGNDELPFSTGGPNLLYIAALMEALTRQVVWLKAFAEPGSEPRNVLIDVSESLDLARSRFNHAVAEDEGLGDMRSVLGAARLALFNRLPDAFDFDRRAFETPLGAFADRNTVLTTNP